jgi:hypothetical protein
LTSRLLYPRQKSPRYPLPGGCVGPRAVQGAMEQGKVFCPYRPRVDGPATSLVALPRTATLYYVVVMKSGTEGCKMRVELTGTVSVSKCLENGWKT